MNVHPFLPSYCESSVMDLRARLERTRWPDSIPGSGSEYGADVDFMRELCAYWQTEFDWKKALEAFCVFQHFRFDAEGGGVHFIHERGKGVRPLPIVITHGWPGSFLEMLKIIPLLTDPASHGGKAEDSFHVVVPSLPGYGFSDRPTESGMNTFRIAETWASLMKDLGYSRYGAQGGDFGANISTILALRDPEKVVGLHLNYIPGSYRPYLEADVKLDATEEQFLKDDARWYEQSGGYSHVQRTEPQTLAYGLHDSPAGLAAWLVEKFRLWADCDGDLYRRFTRDEILTHITLYWMTETFHSSCRLYYESRKAPLHFSKTDFVGVPTGIARFPKEEPFPLRPWVERGYNIQRWSEMPRGGHFAAIEEPELLVEDIREFFRPLRS